MCNIFLVILSIAAAAKRFYHLKVEFDVNIIYVKCN